MKVIFDHLNKVTLVGAAYCTIVEGMSDKEKANVKLLTEEQLREIDKADEIDSINNVKLNLKFKGNYVEFDDKMAGIYTNILYRMKTTNAYFVAKMKEDVVCGPMYAILKKEITKIENNMDEMKEVLSMTLNHLLKIRTFMYDHPEEADKLIPKANELDNARKELMRNTNTLIKLRMDRILEVFDLEGYPSEFKEDEDDLFIKEL